MHLIVRADTAAAVLIPVRSTAVPANMRKAVHARIPVAAG